MSINLNKISDRIIFGALKKHIGAPVAHPLCRPLRSAGVDHCCVDTFMGPYHLTRDGREKPFHYTMWYNLEGEFELHIPGQSVEFVPGMFFLMPSWIPRSIELVSGDTQMHMAFNINLDRGVDWLKPDRSIIRNSIEIHRLRRAIEGLSDELNAPVPASLPIGHYSELILHHLKQDILGQQNFFLDENHLQLANLLQRIKSNLDEKWDTTRMSAELYISRAQLFRMMKRYYQSTPNEFLLKAKMTRASQLLIDTSYSLDMIADQVGYANPYTFSNAFLKETGMRPGAFRKHNRNSGGS